MLYIALLVIAVLKLLTGIFVQKAVKASAQDQEKTITQNIYDLFYSMDTDNSGSITYSEFRSQIVSNKLGSYLASLQMDSRDTEKLFHILDRSGDDEVDIEEFIEGCRYLR